MGEKLRIYIAESDRVHCEVLMEALEHNPQWDVVGNSDDGEQAFRAVQSLRPDVLILALVLKQTDGLSLLRKLTRTDLFHPPRVIVITAMGQVQQDKAHALGADLVMGKPISLEKIFQFLQIDEYRPRLAELGMSVRRTLATQVIDAMAMAKNLAGYGYLIEAVALAASDEQLCKNMMAGLYPLVAQTQGSNVACVERSIRRAIEDTWTSGQMNAMHDLFGYSIDPQRGKPTNGECIARLAEHVRFMLSNGVHQG